MLWHPGDEAERVGLCLLLYFQEEENVKLVSKTGPKFTAKLVEAMDSEKWGSKIPGITTRYSVCLPLASKTPIYVGLVKNVEFFDSGDS